MENIYTFGGVQMTEREHAVISAVSRRGTCPYCGRVGMTKKFGAQGKHMRACGAKMDLMAKEKKFAEWISEANKADREAAQDDDYINEDAMWEQHVHDKHVDQEDRAGVPEDQR